MYGKYVEKVFGPDDRQTAAYKSQDGVDYIPMPLWKTYLIQLLNIAETVFLLNSKKNYLITLIPAIIMTAVTSTYFVVAKDCLGQFGVPYNVGVVIGLVFTVCLVVLFINYKNKILKK